MTPVADHLSSGSKSDRAIAPRASYLFAKFEPPIFSNRRFKIYSNGFSSPLVYSIWQIAGKNQVKIPFSFPYFLPENQPSTKPIKK